MLQESVGSKQSLYHLVLIAVLTVLSQDLSRRGTHAWTYKYSISPSRRWHEARQWCQEHFTDMVSIRTQEENDYLNNLLPYNSKYYWIGIQRERGEWIWTHNNEKVPLEAQNWADNEPDNIPTNNCVEFYVKRGEDAGRWNNEGCQKKKGTICFTESCKQNSCSVHADCVETVGNFTCKCHPGFTGPSCQEAIACKSFLDPEQGSRSCVNPFGSDRFNSSCRFQCKLGFQLAGVPQLLCQASGEWNHPVPLCQVKQCPALNTTNIVEGSMNCSHPIAPFSYNSTCEVRCNQGYELKGQDKIHCDHNGRWSAGVPACSVRKCPSISFPAPGNMTCVDTLGPFSFGTQCSFTCQDGYNLTRDDMLTCLASGKWSSPAPACKVVMCNTLKAPPNASMQCKDHLGVFSYGSTCRVKCEEGFDLIGANMTECSSQGSWSHELPVCRARPCPLLDKSPQHGRMNCSHPFSAFSFGSLCDFECNKGFSLRGKQSLTCNQSGHWSQDLPTCKPVQCGAFRALPGVLSMNCSHPLGDYSFGSQCHFTCRPRFSLNGSEVLFCSSSGLWNDSLPQCKEEGMPLGTALLMYTGVGAASAVILLVLIGLAVLVVRLAKKRGNAVVSQTPTWGCRENPAFEF